ncbi:MAG: MerR family transcriptional regulator [Crocinitomicaceae bacterium]|nr:MerR family transcriptional regulator [Crocinitomicaceae bacterium]|tara:strand:+ start:17726 stop:18070 length:345 start_codon:yes stop_codon:yes gene_type:complete
MEENQIEIPKLTKVYYSIGEVADMFKVNTSLIRFWDKEFDIIQPKKNKKGNRQFTQEDVKNYHLIHFLVKERGYTLKGAKDKIKGNKNEVTNQQQLVKKMSRIKSFLLQLKQEL